MTLVAGTRLGHYEVVAPLGAVSRDRVIENLDGGGRLP
jgi:hypothetical protein